MPEFDLKKCRVCGQEYFEDDVLNDLAMRTSIVEHSQRLLAAIAAVLGVRERMAETLGCSDQEYVNALATLELWLDVVRRRWVLVVPPDMDVALHAGLALTGLLQALVTPTVHLKCLAQPVADARHAVERMAMPWAWMMPTARRSARLESLGWCRYRLHMARREARP